jgi:hypothetical protein
VPAKPIPESVNRLTAAVAVPDEDDDVLPRPAPVERQPAAQEAPQQRTRRRSTQQTAPGNRPGTATIYVSEGVAKRLDDYRRKRQGRTNRDVILEAISANHGQLAEVIEQAKTSTAPESALFPADPRNIKYRGGGKVQVQFTPTPEQAKVLDDLGEQLGFATRSTWIAPVLNHFLPGQKDKGVG